MAISENPWGVKLLRNRSSWFALAAGLIVALAAAGLIWQSLYQAKITAWEPALAAALPLDGPIPNFPTNKVDSILKGGSWAVTYLLDRMEGTLPQRLAGRFSTRLPFLKRFAYVPDSSRQNSIPYILEKMNGTARAHLPRMRRIFLAGPSAHLNLLNAMGKIGRDDPDTIRFLITAGLNPAMPEAVRGNCAFYLGLQSPSEEIVEALKRFYSDPAADVQHYACAALGKHGGAARSAIPLLESASTNANPQVRHAAITSLAKIDPNAAVAKSAELPMPPYLN